MRKRRILSLLLAVAVTVTMLVAVPLTASAADPDPYSDLVAIPKTITKMSFAEVASFDGASPVSTPNPEIEGLHIERYIKEKTDNVYSENKYFRGGGKAGIKDGTNRKIKLDFTDDSVDNATEYTFPYAIYVKSTPEKDIATNDKLFAFKTAEACGVTIYCTDDYTFSVYNATDKIEIGDKMVSKDDTTGKFNSIHLYTEGNEVIQVGGDGNKDAKICLIEFNWDEEPPATPAPVDEVTVTLDSENIEIYEDNATYNLKAMVQLPETIPDGDTGVTWSIEPQDVAKLQNDDTNTVTIKPLKSGSATITAKSKEDPSKQKECSLKINEVPGVKGTPGTVGQLQAATETKIYDLRKAAADGKAINEKVAYKSNCLYENNELFVAYNGLSDAYTGLTYRDSKSSTDVDGSTTNKDSVRIYRNTDIIALKLSKDSTVRLYVTSGGSGDRYGYIEDKLEDCGETKKDDALKNSAAVSSNGSKALLEYTADQDKTIYISGTHELFISQIQVIVPDSDATFGEGATDTGSYDTDGGVEGVIRFLQPYVGRNDVEEYGMYFIGNNGDIEKATIKGTDKLTSDSGGIIADLYGIKKGDSNIYSAMAYVKIDDQTIWSKPINGSIADWDSVKKIDASYK